MRKVSLTRHLANLGMALAAGMGAGGNAPSPAPVLPGDGAAIQAPGSPRQSMTQQSNQAQRASQTQERGSGRLSFMGPTGSIFGFPAWNQRKARRDARRTNRKVVR